MGRKLFGTDGIRGIVNKELDAKTAYMLGLALVKKLADGKKNVKIYIGKDTRASGDMLECALAAGITAAGADAVSLGVVPTPAVAYLVNSGDANAGVMISASHNPAEYNGLKVFASNGMKLPDEVEEGIENILLGLEEPILCDPCKTGKYIDGKYLLKKYEFHVASVLQSHTRPLSVLFDCSNGSSALCAPDIFSDCGIRADFVNCHPNGSNINEKCGSTHIENLSKTVKEGDYDIAFAFDGDADRCLCLDENGEIADGDKIISVISSEFAKTGRLKNGTAVVTVMSNMGIEEAGKKLGFGITRTAVGDRYVLEEMLRGGYSVGGEQSGHIILSDYATTGDGEVTAATVLNIMKSTGKKASELFSAMRKYPQVSTNIRVTPEQKALYKSSKEAKETIASAESALSGRGRIVARLSGTEPLLRLMFEGDDEAMIKNICKQTEEKLKTLLGVNE